MKKNVIVLKNKNNLCEIEHQNRNWKAVKNITRQLQIDRLKKRSKLVKCVG